jgi:predicted DNA-binding protein YlxM (UPF0122 family)
MANKVDKSKALKLRLENNLTYQEIADIQGVTKQAIQSALSKLIPQKDSIEPFKKHRSDIFANTQMKMLNAYHNLTDDEQKELVKRRGLVDMGIIYDKERIESGKSTDNIALVLDSVQQIRAMQVSKTA